MGVVKVVVNGVTKIDLTPTTADASEVNQGDVFFNRSGEQSVGTSDHAKEQQIAYVESGTTASRAYAVGEYFCWHGSLYRVTAAISSGGTFTPGTNCAERSGGGFNELQSITGTGGTNQYGLMPVPNADKIAGITITSPNQCVALFYNNSGIRVMQVSEQSGTFSFHWLASSSVTYNALYIK